MPTERMEEVEVVCACRECGGRGVVTYTWSKGPGPDTCIQCDGTGQTTAFRELPPGSLTAARLRLADAAEEYLMSGYVTASVTLSEALAKQSMASHKMDLAGQALAALRTARGA